MTKKRKRMIKKELNKACVACGEAWPCLCELDGYEYGNDDWDYEYDWDYEENS